MFITKMKLSRRTVLRGFGAAMGLPLLEAMVPALTATAQTAANPQTPEIPVHSDSDRRKTPPCDHKKSIRKRSRSVDLRQ